METAIKLKDIAAKLANGKKKWGSSDTGYIITATKATDNEGRDIGFVLKATLLNMSNEPHHTFVVVSTGTKPRLFPTVASVFKSLQKVGCADFSVSW